MISKRGNFFRHQVDFSEVIENRIKRDLTLRKKRIDEMVNNKRFQSLEKYEAMGEEMIKSISEVSKRQENLDGSIKEYQEKLEEYYIKVQKEAFNKEKFDYYCEQAKSDDIKDQIRGVVGLRKCLAQPLTPPIDKLLESGIVDRLFQLVSVEDQNNSILFEIYWIFVNIAFGNERQVDSLWSRDIVEVIKKRIQNCSSSYVVDQIIWLISNLGFEDKENKLLEDNSIPEFLLKIILDESKTYVRLIPNTIWALANLLRGVKRLSTTQTTINLMNFCCEQLNKYFSTLVSSDEEAVKKIICSSVILIRKLTDFNDDYDNLMLRKLSENKVIEGLVEMLDDGFFKEDRMQILMNCLRIIGNLSAADNDLTSELLEAGVIPKLQKILKKETKPSVIKESCWILSNIASGLQQHKDAFFLQKGLINLLIELSLNEPLNIAKEAIWCLANLTSTNKSHNMIILIEKDILSLLSQWLLIDNQIPVSAVSLEAIENVLFFSTRLNNKLLSNKIANECEITCLKNKLEHLVTTKIEILSEKAYKLLDAYFDRENTNTGSTSASEGSAIMKNNSFSQFTPISFNSVNNSGHNSNLNICQEIEVDSDDEVSKLKTASPPNEADCSIPVDDL